MPMDFSELEHEIKQAFPTAEIKLVDLVGDQNHYSLHIKSDTFVGKSRIQQHKMVYEALGEKMGGVLHALQLKTAPLNNE